MELERSGRRAGEELERSCGGAPDEELQNGPSFCVAFRRFVEFVEKCARNYALELATQAADEDSLTQSSLEDVEPRVWMIAHNGLRLKTLFVRFSSLLHVRIR